MEDLNLNTYYLKEILLGKYTEEEVPVILDTLGVSDSFYQDCVYAYRKYCEYSKSKTLEHQIQ